MASYCSLSSDRSLTKRLIEIADCPSKCLHRFSHTPEWVDGLDIWSLSTISKKCQRYGDFIQDIGLYLPRDEKTNSRITSSKNDIISSKLFTNNYFPSRLRQLFEKEKDLLSENDLNVSLLEETPSNTIEQRSIEITPNRVRLPLRQIQSSKSLFDENSSKQSYQSANQEKFEIILKEHLTHLFTRGATTTFHPKRTLIKIPSVDIKHQNISPKTISSLSNPDPTLIMERYAKLQQLLLPTSSSQPQSQSQFQSQSTINNRQSPLLFQGISTFGLTVTSLEFSSSKQFQSPSQETITRQDNSTSTNRPLTQPVPFQLTANCNSNEQRLQLKRDFSKGYISSSGNFILSNNNSIDEQTQLVRKSLRHHRSLSKGFIEKNENYHLLPPVIQGKRLHIPLSNHRH